MSTAAFTTNGIVHADGTLEVPGAIAVAPGPVEITVRTVTPSSNADFKPTVVKKPPGPPPGWKPGKLTAAGILAEVWTDEDDEILRQIELERKSAVFREIPS